MTPQETVKLMQTIKDSFRRIEEATIRPEQIEDYGRRGYVRGADSIPPKNLNEVIKRLSETFKQAGDTDRQRRFLIFGSAYLYGMKEAGKLSETEWQEMLVAVANYSRVEESFAAIGW